MRRSFAAFLCAVVLSAGLLPAQSTARAGRVRGVVIDSLLGGPLAGATVRIAPLDRSAMTDSAGRFVIDGVKAGEWPIAFRHPALDSLGIRELGANVRVFAGATAVITLATASFEGARNRFCAGTPDSVSETLAFGTVRAADGGRVRVDVSVSWVSTNGAGERPHPGTVRTVSDGEGQSWTACGIPWGAWIHAAMRDSARIASALIQLGPRGIAAQDLMLSSGVTDLRGIVRDRDGRPLMGAFVAVTGTSIAAVTDRTGGFLLPGTPNGTVTLDVRAAGYRPWIGVHSALSGTVSVVVSAMTEKPADRARGSDYLRLLERSDRPGLALLAGPALAADSSSLDLLLPIGTCRWWLDGRPVEPAFWAAQPRRTWQALELYANGADAPPEYRSSGCPVALLWTDAADW
ncbi:MAG: carboxypeptidase regulatory-like domain-containing protein [Gemmatimonadota bacterium]|nr:carboxypeptidase regulatory-like domain-containing protein [Gemmatimonadota bacterium]